MTHKSNPRNETLHDGEWGEEREDYSDDTD